MVTWLLAGPLSACCSEHRRGDELKCNGYHGASGFCFPKLVVEAADNSDELPLESFTETRLNSVEKV